MMASRQGGAEGTELHALSQRERERERRRLRDRQRRQNMSQEERDKHLARRRRNYQLRRLRAEKSKFINSTLPYHDNDHHHNQLQPGPQSQQFIVSSSTTTTTASTTLALVLQLGHHDQQLQEGANQLALCNARDSHEHPTTLAAALTTPTGSTTCGAVGAQEFRRIPRRLRLHHIKHLARTLHAHSPLPPDPADQVVTRQSASSTAFGKSTRRLRLTHIKRLARGLM